MPVGWSMRAGDFIDHIHAGSAQAERDEGHGGRHHGLRSEHHVGGDQRDEHKETLQPLVYAHSLDPCAQGGAGFGRQVLRDLANPARVAGKRAGTVADPCAPRLRPDLQVQPRGGFRRNRNRAPRIRRPAPAPSGGLRDCGRRRSPAPFRTRPGARRLRPRISRRSPCKGRAGAPASSRPTQIGACVFAWSASMFTPVPFSARSIQAEFNLDLPRKARTQPSSACSSSGRIANRSPTSPMSATSKIGASPSLLIATMVPASLMPVRCWIAPLMPTAT